MPKDDLLNTKIEYKMEEYTNFIYFLFGITYADLIKQRKKSLKY